jgi:hypothetical protein
VAQGVEHTAVKARAEVHDRLILDAFSPPPASDPEARNSGWQKPDRYIERRMFTDGEMTMPDGETIRYWGFQDPRTCDQTKCLPSPAIRVQEGECVQIKLELEPEAGKQGTGLRNGQSGDARLKSTSHIYQWQPKSAGTWLYQSHASSLRHFEMGLFGLLIVDPAPDATGKPCAYRDGPAYDVERCWVFDDVDPSWHGVKPDAVLGKDGPAGAMFAPKYFLVNGVANVAAHDHANVAIDAKVGDKILMRLLNASFSLMRIRIQGLKGDIISVDGKALAGPDRPWGKWSPVQPGQPVYMATGARHDVLIDLDPVKNQVKAGDEFLVNFEFLDWSKRAVRNLDALAPLHVGKATTRIRVV